MNPKCSSCARFKKADSFPTCQSCRGLAADRVLGCDEWGQKMGGASFDSIPDSRAEIPASMLRKVDFSLDDDSDECRKVHFVPVAEEGEPDDIVWDSPVHPFVAAGHDLQPRRRFPWRKRR